jgi:hypothetical protein
MIDKKKPLELMAVFIAVLGMNICLQIPLLNKYFKSILA